MSDPKKIRVPTTGRRTIIGSAEWDDYVDADPEAADHWDARVWVSTTPDLNYD